MKKMIIDIHTHFYPRRYLDNLATRKSIPMLETNADGEHFIIFDSEKEVTGGTRAISSAYYSIEKKIEFMDSNGLDKSVVSIGNPWVDFMDPQEARWWATSLNEDIEKICLDDSRFWGLGVVPLQDPQAACAEIERIEKLRRVKGIMIGTRPGGLQLDDPALNPFWETAEGSSLPIFIHPHYTVGYEMMAGYGHAMLFALGFTFESTLAVSRLILGGVLERCPRLKIIVAHAGGTLPFLAGRLDICTKVDGRARKSLTKPFSEYLGMLHYDAVIYHAAGLSCALEVVGSDRLLFGTDHPFGIAAPQMSLEVIAKALEGEDGKEAILSKNAERLLGLPADQ
jgi:aminocarboxymuconate-semialdehyde decarboxylase